MLRVGEQLKNLSLVLSLSGEDKNLPYQVQYSEFVGGPPMLQAFEGGSLDVGFIQSTPLILAQSAGQTVTAVAGWASQGSGYALVSSPGAHSITSWAGLRGKRVAFQEGTALEGALLKGLHSAGLDLSDITPVNVPATQVAATLQGGSADAGIEVEPLLSAYLQANPSAKIITRPTALTERADFLISDSSALADRAKSAAIADYIDAPDQGVRLSREPPERGDPDGLRAAVRPLAGPGRVGVDDDRAVVVLHAARRDARSAAAAGRPLQGGGRDPFDGAGRQGVRPALQPARDGLMTLSDVRAGPSPIAATPIGGPPTGSSALVKLPLAGAAVATKTTRHRSLGKGSQRLIGVVLLLGLWELASLAGRIRPQELAAPTAVVSAGAHLVATGALQSALWASLQRVFWGLAIGVPLGAVLALLAGISRSGENLIDANVQMLRFVPIIGLESLFVLWLGVGETAKISMISLGVMFPIYINTFAAVRSIDPRYHELADVIGLGRWQRIRRIVLPATLPGFLIGLRMAMAVAWLLLVFAEQINASSGLGYLIVEAQTYFQSNVIVVCLACYAVLGLLTDVLVRTLERVLLPWVPGR